MRTVLVLTCCVGMAAFAGAAQQNNNNQNQPIKRKGSTKSQQQVTTQQTGKRLKTTGTGTTAHVQNIKQANTVEGSTKFHKTTATKQSNVSSSASNTAF